MMWGYYTANNSAMMIWMVLQGLFWLALAAFLVWAFVRWLNRPSARSTLPNAPQDLSAIDILKQRYARGEIDAAAFEEMRARLETSTPPANPSTPPREPVTNTR